MVELIDKMGSDLSVVNAARVSYSKQKDVFDKSDEKLIEYLAEHNHWSPFAHASLQFRIEAPIFVARQLVKHQVGLVWNEVSRRYVDDEPTFFKPSAWRAKPKNSKQGSDGVAKSQYFPNLYHKEIHELALKCYKKMIIQGIAPEQARMILPQTMNTTWNWSGTLYAFARVCNLRLDEHAQQETQQIATDIAWHCSKHFPVSWTYLCDVKS